MESASEKPQSAVEFAREYGVDIEQLQLMRSRTPLQRLRLMQSTAQFIVKGRAAIRRQEDRRRNETDRALKEIAENEKNRPE